MNKVNKINKKIIIFSLSLGILFSSTILSHTRANMNDKINLKVLNSLYKIREDEILDSSKELTAKISMAKNESESFQIILNSSRTNFSDLKVEVSDLLGERDNNILDKKNLSVYLEKYIKISKHTDLTGWWPDALLPLEGSFDIKKDRNTSLWITIYTPAYIASDIYRGSLRIIIPDSETIEVDIKVNVFDFKLPKTSYLRTAFSLWPGFIAKRHNIPLNSPKLRPLLKKYWKNMLEHRVSPKNLISPDILKENDELILDFKEFDKEMTYYMDLGQNAFNVFWSGIAYTYGKQRPSTVLLDDPEKIKEITHILKVTERHLLRKKWSSKSYIYLIDECYPKHFSQVKESFGVLKRLAPQIKRLMTFGYKSSELNKDRRYSYEELAGCIDIWVPHLDRFDRDFFRKRQSLDEEVWWYITGSIRHPYANFWAIDYPGLDHRIIFWQTWNYRIEGFLYWCINYWEKDVWEDPVSYPGCNGEGSLIYWGKDGPINSIRWEIIRDGIEDYDYFAILYQKAKELQKRDYDNKYKFLITEAKNACDVSDLVPTLTDYTKDPLKLMQRREEIANLIVRVNKVLKNFSDK